MSRQSAFALLAWVGIAGCADDLGADPKDASGFELARKDHGPWDASPADAAECAGPNPTDPNNSGSFCVSHRNYICLDITWHHVCIDGQWQCPEPGMILSRDCRGWSNMLRDIGDSGFGYFEDGGDASLADAEFDGSMEDDLGSEDSDASDAAGEPDATESVDAAGAD